MTTKAYLRQIQRYESMINNKLAEIYQLKTMACSITVAPKEDKVQTSSDPDRMGKIVGKIVDMEKEVDALIDTFSNKKKVIVSQIDTMEDEDYEVLTSRFVKGLDFDDIPDEVSMSRRKVFYVYKRAMNAFEEKYGKEYLDI